MITENTDGEGLRGKQWQPGGDGVECKVRGKGCVTPVLNFKMQEKKKTKDLRLEEEKKQDVIARKGLAGMSGATLRSLMLLDQVGGLAGK